MIDVVSDARRGHSASLLLLSLVVLLSAGAACRSSDSAPLLIPEPHGLGRLDRTVRSQYEELVGALEKARSDGSVADRSEAWGALGLWFETYRYQDSARVSYDEARRLDPSEPRWHYHRGRLARENAELELAEALFDRSAELAPGALEPLVALGELSLLRQSLDDARARFDRAMVVDPQSVAARLGAARVALASGDAGAAVALLEELERTHPDAGEVQYLLGTAWRLRGEPMVAEEHLSRVPEDGRRDGFLPPKGPWERELLEVDRGALGLTRRAIRAQQQGRQGMATALFGRAVHADPEGPEKRLNYALSLFRSGRVRQAREQLERAVALSEPDSEMAYRSRLELGRLLARSGNFGKATVAIEQALLLRPSSVEGHVEMARLRHRQGRLDEALGHYSAAREADRSRVGVCLWHAALLHLTGSSAEAVAALEDDLVALGPEPDLLLLLARLLSTDSAPMVADVESARRALDRVDGPRDTYYAQTVAMVRAAEGRFEVATAWQQAAIAALEGAAADGVLHTARRRQALYRAGERCANPWERFELRDRTPVEVPS